MSYAKLSNNGCDAISVSLLSNRKFISPTSSTYGIYPRINCLNSEHNKKNIEPMTDKDKKNTEQTTDKKNSYCNPKCGSCSSPCSNKSCC